jgi:hypothetical protein
VLLGRNIALWLGLVQAVLSLALLFGAPLTLPQVGAIEALAAVLIGIVANVNTPGALPTFSLRTKPDGSPSRDLRG